MPSIQVYHYDAFTTKPGKGNPAGIVLNGDELTEIQMQEIAYQVGFNETAFLVESEIADWGIRFFTPGHEMNVCGHATIATIYALKTQKLLAEKSTLTIETKAGVLPLTIDSTSDKETDIIMNQASPTFQAFRGSKQDLAKSIGLQETELDDQLPIVYGSTGTWTLLVPIKELAVFQKMKPNNQDFPSILQEIPTSSVHPFCTETHNPQADMHARHFSSPYSGTIEDAVTGTASGVMGAYFATYMDKGFDESLNLIVEQGHEISKEGMVGVKVLKRANTLDVKITGNAVYVNDVEVII